MRLFHSSRKARVGLIALAFVLLVLVLGWQVFGYRFRLHWVPPEMKVWHVLYVREVSRGFGPGASETGVIAYALPKATAQEIIESGLGYFTSLPSQQQDGKPWQYEQWYKTPLEWHKVTYQQPLLSGASETGVAAYLNQWGRGVTLRPAIETEINQVAASKGAYYAQRGNAMILVAPTLGRAFFFYAG